MKKVRDMFDVKAQINQGKSVSAIARAMGIDWSEPHFPDHP